MAALAIVTAFVALGGGMAGRGAPDLAASLSAPNWVPPAWFVIPLWSALHVLMTMAAWMELRLDGWRERRGWLLLYLSQLVVNALWAWLFLGWRSGPLALLYALLLWGLVLSLMATSWRGTLVRFLLLPMLAWATFAAFLTWTVWRANLGVFR